jgi:hypothetical protein
MDKWMLLALQEEEHSDEERKKAQAMTLMARIKPFFIEMTFYTGWGETPTRGVVNGAHIESIQAVHPTKPQKGTIINYVFGDTQRVTETVDVVVAALKSAVDQANY